MALSKKEKANRLKIYFSSAFLDKLADGDAFVLDMLKRCYCEVNVVDGKFEFIFSLLGLYQALIGCAEHDGHMIVEHDKGYSYFSAALMHPWPMEAFRRHGLRLEKIKRRSPYTGHDWFCLSSLTVE